VRDFTDQTPAREVLAGLLDAAVWAPSGVNQQPWRFFIVDDRKTLAVFSSEAKAMMLGQAAEHPELAGIRTALATPGFNIFYNAPVLIVTCAATADEMAIKDCCLAAENLMLAAYAHGLGSCWIGLSEAWLNTRGAKARLGIPEGFRPVAPIIVGYPKSTGLVGERLAPDVHYVRPEAG
jgi:nitroreductase